MSLIQILSVSKPTINVIVVSVWFTAEFVRARTATYRNSQYGKISKSGRLQKLPAMT